MFTDCNCSKFGILLLVTTTTCNTFLCQYELCHLKSCSHYICTVIHSELYVFIKAVILSVTLNTVLQGL